MGTHWSAHASDPRARTACRAVGLITATGKSREVVISIRSPQETRTFQLGQSAGFLTAYLTEVGAECRKPQW